jgi:hypothetical protein
MLTLKRWPATGAPADDGLVIVVLHPASRATVLVVPSGARTPDIQELDMGMPMALYRAQIEAARRGLHVVYVSPGEEAPWEPEWGVLVD